MRHAMSTPTAYGMTAFARRQDAADRQPVADVRVRHQRARDRDRQLARVLQLLQRVGLEVVAPDQVRRVVLARYVALLVRLALQYQASEFAVDGIGGSRLRRRRDPPKSSVTSRMSRLASFACWSSCLAASTA